MEDKARERHGRAATVGPREGRADPWRRPLQQVRSTPSTHHTFRSIPSTRRGSAAFTSLIKACMLVHRAGSISASRFVRSIRMPTCSTIQLFLQHEDSQLASECVRRQQEAARANDKIEASAGELM